MAADPANVFTLASAIRDEVIALYAAASLPLPARRLVSEGFPAWDSCEQLIVELRRVVRGNVPTEDLSPINCAGVRFAELHVWIIRCAAPMNQDGSPPAVAAIETVAETLYTDAWFLPTSLAESVSSGTLATPCHDVVVGPLRIQGPEGGYVGVDLTVLWQLPY